MSDIVEIEAAVRELSAAELTKFRAWFAEFDAQTWDRQFEADVEAGKLDELADAALLEHRGGRTTPRRGSR